MLKSKTTTVKRKNLKKFLQAYEKKLNLVKKTFPSKKEKAEKSKILLNLAKEKQPINIPIKTAPLKAIRKVLQLSKCSLKLNNKLLDFLKLFFMLNFMKNFVELC